MALDQSLASVPGLAGFLAKRQMNEQGLGGEIQQLGGAMNLSSLLGQKKDEEQIKSIIESGAPPEKVVGALMSMGPKGAAAAHQYATALKDIQAAKSSERFRTLTPEQLQNPDALEQAGASGVPGTAHLTGVAERLRKKAEAEAALKGMQSGAQTIQPDPQEIAQAADQGTPVPMPAQVKRGGIFDDLANSQIPHIAQAAKNMQAQLDRSGATIPPAYWQKQHETLAAREGQYLQAKALSDQRKGDAAMPVIPPQHADKHGDDFLNTLPVADRSLVKKIASYDIDPKTLSTKGGQREKMLSLVAQFDPTYDDTQYANKRRAITQFGSGPLGGQVRSLNVAIEHIDTLQRAADALKNGSFTPGNKAFNEVAKVFGQTPPNTFEGIRDIVANEVVKGTIGNAGALADRSEAAAKVKASSSPQQLKELMNGWTELMGGQVKGLEKQYESATKNKDFRERYLRQRTIDAINLAESKATAVTAPPPGGTYQDADKERRYQEWKKANGR